jgi:long-chain acyl-CoA synthetase
VENAYSIPRETLPALIRRCLSEPREAALLERVEHAWTLTSSSKLLERASNLACAIRDAGLSSGDRVAILAADCVDWVVADFATLFAGCIVVPIFPTQAVDQVAYILQDSQAKLIFADTFAAIERLQHMQIVLPRAIVFQSSGDDGLRAFETRGAGVRSQHPDWPQALQAGVQPDDMAVLIYTSGTTGEPKGVMLSHYNLAFTAQSSFTRAFSVITPGSNVISVLPFSHIYEHCIVYGYLLAGARHHICHSVEELLGDLQDVRPVAFTAVPRIFERMLAGIAVKAKLHGGVRARLVPWALDAGRRYMTAITHGERPSALLALQFRIARALVLNKIRPMMGLDRVKFLVSGSAPLHFDIAMTMRAIGIEIIEGYGPTECSPVVTVNTYGENHYGTVGQPIPGVEIKLAPDGEVLAKGPNVMLGYYHNERATAEAIEGGWYHTGDVGVIDSAGYLHITDRKKEIFKTSGGKFVAPARVEAAIKRSVYVSQAIVVGEGHPHPAALVSPNWELLRAELGIDTSVPATELVHRHDVEEFMTKEVRKHTLDLAKFEQIRKIALLSRDLTVEDGELSPALKVKRRVVETKYAAEIGHLYAGGAEHAASYA